MVSPYKIAGYAGLVSLILSFFVAGIAISMENTYDPKPQYITYLGILLLSIGLSILYFRGFIVLAKILSDKKFLAIVLSVFVITVLAAITQFVYSSILFLETSAFNIYDALMHQNSTHGLLLFNLHLGLIAILLGYGLTISKIPSKLAYYSGIVSVVSGLVILLISDILGGLLYIIAGIMLLVLLFRMDNILEINNKENIIRREEKKDEVFVTKKKPVRKTIKKKMASKNTKTK